jgi:hypothetical protein
VSLARSRLHEPHSRSRAVAGHLRTSLVLGAGSGFLWYAAGIFRKVADGRGDANTLWHCLGSLWPGPCLLGAGVFALLALPAVWPLLCDRGLAGKLRDRRLLPRRLAGPLLHWSISTTLSITMTATASLCLLFLECENSLAEASVEALCLPIACQAREGPPPEPRLIVNVLSDGTVRIDGTSYEADSLMPRIVGSEWREPGGWHWDGAWSPPAGRPGRDQTRTFKEMGALLAREAARCREPDGYSALTAYIRADADVPAKYVQAVLDACRRAKVYRLSFGVSPMDPYGPATTEAE